MTEPAPEHRDIVPRTDRGLTEAGDRGHRDYVMAKIAEAATQVSLTSQQLEHIRNPVAWDRAVELWGDAKTLHDMLAYGHQHIHGRTPENGWRQEYRQQVPGHRDRQHDNAKVVQQAGREVVVATTEYKAGGVRVDKGLEQLAKERALLKSGTTRDVSEYVIRAARPPAVEVMREARKLAKEFPGKFKVIELSESDFRRYIDAGRPIAHAKAVERLGHLIERIRQSPELKTAPRAIEQFVQEIEKAKGRGEPIGLGVLVESRVELAQLLEADGRITQERDKAAREAAHLRLREAQIVERVQAQQRADRHDRLAQLVARVDHEIVASTVASVRAQVPRGPAKAPTLERGVGTDPTQAAMATSMQQVMALMHQQANAARAQQELKVLEGIALPTAMHHEVAQLVLEQQRDGPVTAEHIQAAAQEVHARHAAEREKARQEQARERENREIMDRVAAAYNKRLAEVAREQSLGRGVDRSDDAHHARHVELLARDLRMDAGRMVERGVDARVVEELARGNATLDQAAHAYVVEIDQQRVYVGKESQEAAVARQIHRVAQGMDLDRVEAHRAMEAGRVTTPVARSRDELDRQREELERQRIRGQERHGSGRTIGERGKDGPVRGLERGR